jgi:uncharacterized coiled-coil protein SlyX
MKLDTQPLLLAAARYSLKGHLDAVVLAELRTEITKLEGRLALLQEYVEAYEASRARLVLDGTAMGWARWRAENLLLISARADAERVHAQLRFAVERLETEVALAQQRAARVLAGTEGAQA